MCEPLLPIDELKNLRFAISALVENVGSPGSYERENAQNSGKGIKARLNWCIANLERAGEGKKNFGIDMYPVAEKGPG